MTQASAVRPIWQIAGVEHEMGGFPWIMGILNVTPDSFSDGGAWMSVQAAIDQGRRLVDDGAHLLDIGGESTRPGATPVDAEEECRRVLPVIETLRAQVSVPISIDTTKAVVARRALAAGASIVNDVSALEWDPEMRDVCGASDCGVILMHTQGTPQTMQRDPRYDDVVREVRQYLDTRISQCVAAGIEAARIVIDPGIGFGKTAEHNLSLLANIATLRGSGRPVLVGHSRKGFLRKLIGRDVDERLAGTLGVSIALAQQNVDLLRVHDVAAVRDALTAWSRIRDSMPTS